MITIGDILLPEHILLDLKAGTHIQATAKVAELLESDERVNDWDRFYDGLIDGSACMANEHGSALCIAHVRTHAVSSMIMAVGRSSEGIPIQGDSARVRLIFVIGVPVALASDYLRIIGALARIFRTEKGEQALLTAETPEEFFERLCTLEMEM
ncbi:MAG: PTS sugar transporter subunit IIA [Verrucomicrobia bacterium]|nr:PTS sugar transporter subunit IIA [Verrucomicrobiota bacterium]